MRPAKPTIPNFLSDQRDEHREARQIALEYLAEAWNAAEDEGIESIALAQASLFAALATLVRHYGEEPTAKLVAALPERILSGEYNIERATH
jgi:hypothetical protein